MQRLSGTPNRGKFSLRIGLLHSCEPTRPLRPLIRCLVHTCCFYSETPLHNYVCISAEETAIRLLALGFGFLTKCRRVSAARAGMEGSLDDEVAVPFAVSQHLPVQ